MKTTLFLVLVACCLASISCGVPPGDQELIILGSDDSGEAHRSPTEVPGEPKEAEPQPDASPHPEPAPKPDDVPQPDPVAQAPDAGEVLVDEQSLQTDAAAPEALPEPAPDAGPETKPEPPPPPPLPKFPHFDDVIDLHRGGVPVWATLLYIVPKGPGQKTHRSAKITYNKRGHLSDFWPASTIKVYVATAALVLLKQYGVSLDAKAEFSYRSGSSWVKDTTRSFRDMLFDSITCSSNSDYTLLLRFVGVDWLNKSFLIPRLGFAKSALMVGYVSARPYGYDLSREQRIVLREGSATHTRTHKWSGAMYGTLAGCKSGRTNCTTTDDLAEHLRRIFFHEELPASQRFDLRRGDLDFFRYGKTKPLLNSKCTTGGWSGVKRVLPQANYYHKTGSVTSYKLDMAYVEDKHSDTYYVLALATRSEGTGTLLKLSEEIARMALTPDHYVHLASLRDGVNPVKAQLTVYSKDGGKLDLLTRPYSQSRPQPPSGPTQMAGWRHLPGSTTTVPPGLSSHTLRSSCLNRSQKVHIIGRLDDPMWSVLAYSDLHYVIVDASIQCP